MGMMQSTVSAFLLYVHGDSHVQGRDFNLLILQHCQSNLAASPALLPHFRCLQLACSLTLVLQTACCFPFVSIIIITLFFYFDFHFFVLSCLISLLFFWISTLPCLLFCVNSTWSVVLRSVSPVNIKLFAIMLHSMVYPWQICLKLIMLPVLNGTVLKKVCILA